MNKKLKIILWSVIGILLLSVAGYISFGPNINQRLISDLIAEEKIQEPDLMVVLGAGVTPDGFLTDLSQERVDYALKLYEQYDVPILFSGGKTPSGVESIVMNEYAKNNGYNGVDLIEGKSTSTWENAQFSKEVIDQINVPVNDILIITSNYHSRRAFAVFRSSIQDQEVFLTYPKESVVLNDSFLGRWKGVYALLREYTAIQWYETKYTIEI